MKNTCALALLALAPAALAQFSTASTVTFALDWSDVNGTPNGILEPGESALIRLSVSFTNQNTTASFSPAIGQFTSGTIRGLGSGFLDLNGIGQTQGTWDLTQANGYGVTPSWDITGQPIHVVNAGASLQQIQFGQLPFNAGNIVTTNPVVNIFTALWTPATYAAGYREFRIAASAAAGNMAAALDLKTSAGSAVGVYVPAVYTSVVISAPAPASSLLLTAPLLWLGRRRPVHCAS